MKTFEIQITEKLVKSVKVTADSLEDAVITVKSKYKNDEITLDYSNFQDVTFESVDFESKFKSLVNELIEFVFKAEKNNLTSNNSNQILLKLEILRELNSH
ncbi:MAG: DpnD/PcfM family protein [Pyrinomonadaceae bacterium]|nr:DpnD/PcfM family protein [Pyrinomonadaceae bacterium]